MLFFDKIHAQPLSRFPTKWLFIYLATILAHAVAAIYTMEGLLLTIIRALIPESG